MAEGMERSMKNSVFGLAFGHQQRPAGLFCDKIAEQYGAGPAHDHLTTKNYEKAGSPVTCWPMTRV